MGTATTSLRPFEEQLAASWPPSEWIGVGVVVAVSGGADSVALARGLYRLKTLHGGSGELVAAHFHHNLRPEADVDQAWLAALCDRLGLPFMTGRGDVRAVAAEQGDGIEAAARSARLAFLQETAEYCGARLVATAHSSDDQVETVLFRILRGTGLGGLGGIRRARPLSESVTLIRPMLQATRANAREYLTTIGQEWREDATNADHRFTRNRIRHHLLPRLRNDYNSNVDDAILRLARQAKAVAELLECQANALADQCVRIDEAPVVGQEPSGNLVRIRTSVLIGEHPLLIAEVCRVTWRKAGWHEQAMTEAHWQWLVDLVRGQASPPNRSLPGNILAERTGSEARLQRAEPKSDLDGGNVDASAVRVARSG